MPRHITGSKITRSHTTATVASELVVNELVRLPEVKKIALSKITNGLRSSSQVRVKLFPYYFGFRAMIRGGYAVQEIFIYTNQHKRVRTHLKQKFEVKIASIAVRDEGNYSSYLRVNSTSHMARKAKPRRNQKSKYRSPPKKRPGRPLWR